MSRLPGPSGGVCRGHGFTRRLGRQTARPKHASSSPAPERQLIGCLGVRCLVVSRDCALAASVNVCVSSAGGLARKGMDDHR